MIVVKVIMKDNEKDRTNNASVSRHRNKRNSLQYKEKIGDIEVSLYLRLNCRKVQNDEVVDISRLLKCFAWVSMKMIPPAKNIKC